MYYEVDQLESIRSFRSTYKRRLHAFVSCENERETGKIREWLVGPDSRLAIVKFTNEDDRDGRCDRVVLALLKVPRR